MADLNTVLLSLIIGCSIVSVTLLVALVNALRHTIHARRRRERQGLIAIVCRAGIPTQLLLARVEQALNGEDVELHDVDIYDADGVLQVSFPGKVPPLPILDQVLEAEEFGTNLPPLRGPDDEH